MCSLGNGVDIEGRYTAIGKNIQDLLRNEAKIPPMTVTQKQNYFPVYVLFGLVFSFLRQSVAMYSTQP